jgi:hypothetical protein
MAHAVCWHLSGKQKSKSKIGFISTSEQDKRTHIGGYRVKDEYTREVVDMISIIDVIIIELSSQ